MVKIYIAIMLPFLILACPHMANTKNVDKEWVYFRTNHNLYLEELSKTVFSSLNRIDTQHPIFHGCIDWHSSVHGYWALLRATKYTQNKEYLDFVKNSLESPLLNEERLFLKNKNKFEMPYGRSWFLRLAIEYESVSKLSTLRPMADEVAQSLVEYYRQNSPVPGLSEYNNAEWAFRNLYDYAFFTKNIEILSFINSQAKFFLTPNLQLSLDYDRELYPHFFSKFGNYFHLLEVITDRRKFLEILNKIKPTYKEMLPITSFKNDHHLGINYSRAWGLWSLYKKTNNIVYRNAYLENVKIGFQEHNVYKNDYFRYGHWVPQFGIYAITYPLEDAVVEPD